jgi:hypothetical protein
MNFVRILHPRRHREISHVIQDDMNVSQRLSVRKVDVSRVSSKEREARKS